MSYEFNAETGVLSQNGSPLFDIDREINAQMFGYCATPIWAAQFADGRAVVDAANRRITFQADHGVPRQTFTARVEEDREEILAGVNAVKALFPGRDDAWAKAYLKFHRRFDLYNAG